NGVQWAAQHTAVFRPDLTLKSISEVTIAPEPFQRRNRGREERIEVLANVLPILIDCLDGQIGFRVEKVIKAALLHAGLFTDLIDGRAAIRACPNQLSHSFHQSLFGITHAPHMLCYLLFFFYYNDSLARVDCLFNIECNLFWDYHAAQTDFRVD